MIRGQKSTVIRGEYSRTYWRRVDEDPRFWLCACLFLFALLILYLLGVLFIAPRAEQETQIGVTSALERAGYYGLTVIADGQEVLIEGAGTEKDEQVLNTLAYRARCDTWAGELVCPTSIKLALQQKKSAIGNAEVQALKEDASRRSDAASLLPDAGSSGSPHLERTPATVKETHFNFLFSLSDGRLSLTGLAPAALGRNWASDNAKQAFDRVENQLSIIDGDEVEHYSWAAAHAITTLSHLESGHAVWTGQKLAIWGDVLKKDEQRLHDVYSGGGMPELHGELHLNVIEDKGNYCNHGFEALFPKPSIPFNTGSAKIPDKSRNLLVAVALALESCALSLNVNGHTDSNGNRALNKKLSLARAQSVVDVLAVLGVDISRMKVQGYGSSKPIASNHDSAGRAKNRRTEIHPVKL